MKIAFFYSNEGLGQVKSNKPYEGNPGVGGTQYCFLLLIYYLSKVRTDWEILVYTLEETILPKRAIQKNVKDIFSATNHASKDRVDIFVFKPIVDEKLYKLIDNLNVNTITWGHNYYFAPLAKLIANNKNIKANVFVGKQQYDRYIDHSIISKSTFIYNMITDPYPVCDRFNDNRTVVYMGALIPSKGFLELAKIWKLILKRNPQAKLKVIGTGSVYSRNSTLGLLGVADKSYEDQFLPFITDESGKLLDSVKFLGLLGENKYEIFREASVGVVNPTARTETFGMSIVEMGAMKLPVVTLNKNGYPDTIKNGVSGFLCNNEKDLVDKIDLLLRNVELNNKLGEGAKQNIKRFFPEEIMPNWINLFEKVYNNEDSIEYLGFSKPVTNNNKWIRIINRFIKFNLGVRFIPSMIQIETAVYVFLGKVKNRLKN